MRINRTFAAFASGVALSVAAVVGINACVAPELEDIPAPEVQVGEPGLPPVEVPVDPADVRRDFIQGLIDQGDVVGTVIVCEEGWAVSQDVTPDGIAWAACM